MAPLSLQNRFKFQQQGFDVASCRARTIANEVSLLDIVVSAYNC